MSKHSTPIQIKILKFNEYDQWDQLNQNSPFGNFFNASFYLDIVNKYYPNIFIIGFYKNNELIAGLPFREKRKYGLKQAAPLPFTPYNGIIISHKLLEHTNYRQEVLIAKLLTKFDDYIKARKFKMIEFKLSPELIDIRPLQWLGWRCIANFTYHNKLTSRDQLYNNFTYAIQKQINKSIKNSICIVEEDKVENFNYLFNKTFSRQSQKTPITTSFFNNLVEKLTQNQSGQLYIARDKVGHVISGLIVGWFKNRGYLLFGGSDPNYRRTGATAFLHWEVMDRLINRKINVLDWCGANMPSIVKFKQQFNPELKMYWQVKKNNIFNL